MATELYDIQMDELLARDGTFDITGTGAVTNKQYWGFNATDGTVIASIKGIPLKTVVTTLAQIRTAEEDISALVVTSLAAGLLGGLIYRVRGYVITSIQLTSGSLHTYLQETQISL
jgi:hypothetical protein